MVFIAVIYFIIVYIHFSVQLEARQVEVKNSPETKTKGDAEQIEELFTIKYGTDIGQIGATQRKLEGTDLIPMT